MRRVLAFTVSVFCALCISPSEVSAQSEDAEANRLFVEAVKLYRQSEEVTGNARLEAYQKVRSLFDEILKDHPDSRPAKVISQGGSPGGVTIANLPRSKPKGWNDGTRGIVRDLLLKYDNDVGAIEAVAEGSLYAYLAWAAYDAAEPKQFLEKKGWKLLDTFKGDRALVGDVTAGLYQGPQGQHVLTFRGSVTGGDWVTNVGGTLSPTPLLNGQVIDALNLAEEIAQKFPDVVFVGHSLGGRLAQASSLKTGNLAYAFNSAPVGYNEIREMGFQELTQGKMRRFRSPQDQLSAVFTPSDTVVANIEKVDANALFNLVNAKDYTHAMNVLAHAMESVSISWKEGWVTAYLEEIEYSNDEVSSSNAETLSDTASLSLPDTSIATSALCSEVGNQLTNAGLRKVFSVSRSMSGRSLYEGKFYDFTMTTEPAQADGRWVPTTSVSGGRNFNQSFKIESDQFCLKGESGNVTCSHLAICRDASALFVAGDTDSGVWTLNEASPEISKLEFGSSSKDVQIGSNTPAESKEWGPSIVPSPEIELGYIPCRDYTDVRICLTEKGLHEDAIDFAFAVGGRMVGEVFAMDFRETGKIDLAHVLFNGASPHVWPVLLNGDLQEHEVKGTSDLAATFRDSTSQRLLRRFPNAFSSTDFIQAHRILEDGTQRFVLIESVVDGCRACPILGSAITFLEIGPSTGGAVRRRPIGLSLVEPHERVDLSEKVLREQPDSLQAVLNANGYEAGEMDGYPGPQTRSALMAFQAEHCLSATGQLNQETAASLIGASGFDVPCMGQNPPDDGTLSSSPLPVSNVRLEDIDAPYVEECQPSKSPIKDEIVDLLLGSRHMRGRFRDGREWSYRFDPLDVEGIRYVQALTGRSQGNIGQWRPIPNGYCIHWKGGSNSCFKLRSCSNLDGNTYAAFRNDSPNEIYSTVVSVATGSEANQNVVSASTAASPLEEVGTVDDTAREGGMRVDCMARLAEGIFACGESFSSPRSAVPKTAESLVFTFPKERLDSLVQLAPGGNLSASGFNVDISANESVTCADWVGQGSAEDKRGRFTSWEVLIPALQCDLWARKLDDERNVVPNAPVTASYVKETGALEIRLWNPDAFYASQWNQGERCHFSVQNFPAQYGDGWYAECPSIDVRTSSLATGTQASQDVINNAHRVEAAVAYFEPERGSVLRSSILDAVRPIAEGQFGPPVEFVVETIRVAEDQAYVELSAQRPNGVEIDLAATPAGRRGQVDVNAGNANVVSGFLIELDGEWKPRDIVTQATEAWWIDECEELEQLMPETCRTTVTAAVESPSVTEALTGWFVQLETMSDDDFIALLRAYGASETTTKPRYDETKFSQFEIQRLVKTDEEHLQWLTAGYSEGDVVVSSHDIPVQFGPYDFQSETFMVCGLPGVQFIKSSKYKAQSGIGLFPIFPKAAFVERGFRLPDHSVCQGDFWKMGKTITSAAETANLRRFPSFSLRWRSDLLLRIPVEHAERFDNASRKGLLRSSFRCKMITADEARDLLRPREGIDPDRMGACEIQDFSIKAFNSMNVVDIEAIFRVAGGVLSAPEISFPQLQ